MESMLIYFVAGALMLKGAVRHVMVALVAAAYFWPWWVRLSFPGTGFFIQACSVPWVGIRVCLATLAGVNRATATTGQPIVLGFVMMVALLFPVLCAALRVPRGAMRTLLWLLMGMGLVAAMSRGPWVGAAIGLFVIALASTNPLGNVLKLLTGFV